MGRKAALPTPTSLKESPEFDEPQFARKQRKSGQFATKHPFTPNEPSDADEEGFDSMLVSAQPLTS